MKVRKKQERVDMDAIDVYSVLTKLGVRIMGRSIGWITVWRIFHPDGDVPNLRVRENQGDTFR